jgi:hypothetical protein
MAAALDAAFNAVETSAQPGVQIGLGTAKARVYYRLTALDGDRGPRRRSPQLPMMIVRRTATPQRLEGTARVALCDDAAPAMVPHDLVEG